MAGDGSRVPPNGGIQVTVAAPGWRRAVKNPEQVAVRVLRSLGSAAEVVLADDRAVRRLNARYCGRDKPTNVLTFSPAAPGLPGSIVVALGTVRREAVAAGKRPAQHLAHLVAHGCLHLAGCDHQAAGAARAMEMAETRALARLGVPNPWRPR
jgi:probable rRNA maturation factor